MHYSYGWSVSAVVRLACFCFLIPALAIDLKQVPSGSSDQCTQTMSVYKRGLYKYYSHDKWFNLDIYKSWKELQSPIKVSGIWSGDAAMRHMANTVNRCKLSAQQKEI